MAVEACAMNKATDFYSAQGWTVDDVHGTESYDLICRRGDEVKHVEVKGTTTDGAEVILTPTKSGTPGKRKHRVVCPQQHHSRTGRRRDGYRHKRKEAPL